MWTRKDASVTPSLMVARRRLSLASYHRVVTDAHLFCLYTWLDSLCRDGTSWLTPANAGAWTTLIAVILFFFFCFFLPTLISCCCWVAMAFWCNSSFHVAHPVFPSFFLFFLSLLIIISVELCCALVVRCRVKKTMFCCGHVAFRTLDSNPSPIFVSFSRLLERVVFSHTNKHWSCNALLKDQDGEFGAIIHDMWLQDYFSSQVLWGRFCPQPRHTNATRSFSPYTGDYNAWLSDFNQNKLVWFPFKASGSTLVHLHLSWSPGWFQGRLLKIVCRAGQLENVSARLVAARLLLIQQTCKDATLLLIKWPWTTFFLFGLLQLGKRLHCASESEYYKGEKTFHMKMHLL